MTEYSIQSVGSSDGAAVVWLKVGKREKLEQIRLSREQALRLTEQLVGTLRYLKD